MSFKNKMNKDNYVDTGLSRLSITEYFDEIPEFKLIPEYYQNRIIDFFNEDRHYMVDPSDIRMFLAGNNWFEVFKSTDALESSLNIDEIVGVLGCNRHFDTVDEFDNWARNLNQLRNETGDEISTFVMTHSFGFVSDLPEEWYIASYV
jgi:hypothetical protein